MIKPKWSTRLFFRFSARKDYSIHRPIFFDKLAAPGHYISGGQVQGLVVTSTCHKVNGEAAAVLVLRIFPARAPVQVSMLIILLKSGSIWNLQQYESFSTTAGR